MIYTSHWTINNKILYIINAYNVENIYEEKNRQTKEILITDIIILTISTIVISIFSILLTKPINNLNKTTKKIASGQINERAKIKSTDEIGELAQSFNKMADEIENKIKQLNEQVKQKNDFITGFTHELKTPMTAIMGYADMLRLKKCDEELTKKALNYIYTETKRLENLSFKLMELMSVADGQIEMNDIEIDKLIEKIAKEERNILSHNKIELNVEKALVIGDGELLENVIRNLIENANKAEPKDNKIIIKGEKIAEDKYKISIMDKGKGIPKEHINRVTEDFYMVDKSRNKEQGGSGIGLSLVKKILNYHNSELEIQSQENVGTVVSFKLKEVKNSETNKKKHNYICVNLHNYNCILYNTTNTIK